MSTATCGAGKRAREANPPKAEAQIARTAPAPRRASPAHAEDFFSPPHQLFAPSSLSPMEMSASATQVPHWAVSPGAPALPPPQQQQQLAPHAVHHQMSARTAMLARKVAEAKSYQLGPLEWFFSTGLGHVSTWYLLGCPGWVVVCVTGGPAPCAPQPRARAPQPHARAPEPRARAPQPRALPHPCGLLPPHRHPTHIELPRPPSSPAVRRTRPSPSSASASSMRS